MTSKLSLIIGRSRLRACNNVLEGGKEGGREKQREGEGEGGGIIASMS